METYQQLEKDKAELEEQCKQEMAATQAAMRGLSDAESRESELRRALEDVRRGREELEEVAEGLRAEVEALRQRLEGANTRACNILLERNDLEAKCSQLQVLHMLRTIKS